MARTPGSTVHNYDAISLGESRKTERPRPALYDRFVRELIESWENREHMRTLPAKDNIPEQEVYEGTPWTFHLPEWDKLNAIRTLIRKAASDNELGVKFHLNADEQEVTYWAKTPQRRGVNADSDDE